jgi:hypothetical protein
MVSVARRALWLALSAVLLSASVALASNGATVTHFTAQYPAWEDPTLGFDCTGNRIVKSVPNSFVKDSEVCRTNSDAIAPGAYAIVPFTGDIYAMFWISDYEAYTLGPAGSPDCDPAFLPDVCYRFAVSGTLTVTYSESTGLYTWSISAYYAP